MEGSWQGGWRWTGDAGIWKEGGKIIRNNGNKTEFSYSEPISRR